MEDQIRAVEECFTVGLPSYLEDEWIVLPLDLKLGVLRRNRVGGIRPREDVFRYLVSCLGGIFDLDVKSSGCKLSVATAEIQS